MSGPSGKCGVGQRALGVGDGSSVVRSPLGEPDKPRFDETVRAFTTTARMMLASPPRLVEPPEFVFEQQPPALPAGYGGPRMIGAAPERFDPAPVSPAPRERFTIDAEPDAVREMGYAPVSPARPASPAPWGSPRDRFSTDQFAAVR